MRADMEKDMDSWKNVVVVTNRKLARHPFAEQIERVCQKRPRAVIVREKNLDRAEYGQILRDVNAICRKYGVACIGHTFPEETLSAGIKAIHLPLPVLREYGGKDSEILQDFEVIGASVHSVEEAGEAVSLGASYLTAGHIYATDCKKGLEPRGLSFLKEVCQASSVPVYAIGGIHVDSGQIEEVMRGGVAGACIMSEAMKI